MGVVSAEAKAVTPGLQEGGISPPEADGSTRGDMKILLIVHLFFPKHRSGTEVLTLELARGLLRKGHHVEILAGAANHDEERPPWLTETTYDGITVHHVNYRGSPFSEPAAL